MPPRTTAPRRAAGRPRLAPRLAPLPRLEGFRPLVAFPFFLFLFFFATLLFLVFLLLAACLAALLDLPCATCLPRAPCRPIPAAPSGPPLANPPKATPPCLRPPCLGPTCPGPSGPIPRPMNAAAPPLGPKPAPIPPIGPNPPPNPPPPPPNPPPPNPPSAPNPPPPKPPARPCPAPRRFVGKEPPPLRPRGASACSARSAVMRFCAMPNAALNSCKLILPSWFISKRLKSCLPISLFRANGLARNSSSLKKPSLSLSKSFMTCAGRGQPFKPGPADCPPSGGAAAAAEVRASEASPAIVIQNLDIKISFQEKVTQRSRPQPIGGDFLSEAITRAAPRLPQEDTL